MYQIDEIAKQKDVVISKDICKFFDGFMSKKDSRWTLEGCYFACDDNKEVENVVCTDGYKLVLVDGKLEKIKDLVDVYNEYLKPEDQHIFPLRWYDTYSKKAGGKIKTKGKNLLFCVQINGDYRVLQLENIYLDATYPDYTYAIPKNQDKYCRLNIKEVRKQLENYLKPIRFNNRYEEAHKKIKIEDLFLHLEWDVEKKLLNIKVNDSEDIIYTSSIKTTGETENLDLYVNYKYFLDMIKSYDVFKINEVTISNGKHHYECRYSPLKFNDKENKIVSYLMPMRHNKPNK